MKHIYFILLICFLSNPLAGQDATCRYRATPEDYRRMRELEALALQSPRQIYEDNVVKVAMYRLRHDDGSGALTDSAFAEQINYLNTYYNEHDICFSLVRIQNIDNSGYINQNWNNDTTEDSLFAIINQENPSFNDALTIYVLPPQIFFTGSAYGIPSTAFMMTSHPARWHTSNIAHEVGHCLGNFHTHDDTEEFHLELVNRFCPIPPFYINDVFWWDCCTGADGLVDTPADPMLNDTNYLGEPRVIDCEYVDSLSVDGFNELYTPDVSNLMSYAPIPCRTHFSGQQVTRMHLTLDLNTEYNNKQVPTTRELNGEVISSGYRHEMAKTTMMVSNSSAYTVINTGQVMHEAEGQINLFPGFIASPSNTTGFYVARVRDLCNNDTSLDYCIKE